MPEVYDGSSEWRTYQLYFMQCAEVNAWHLPEWYKFWVFVWEERRGFFMSNWRTTLGQTGRSWRLQWPFVSTSLTGRICTKLHFAVARKNQRKRYWRVSGGEIYWRVGEDRELAWSCFGSHTGYDLLGADKPPPTFWRSEQDSVFFFFFLASIYFTRMAR